MDKHKVTYVIDDVKTGAGHFTVGEEGPFDYGEAMTFLTEQAGRTAAGAQNRLHNALARAMTRACGRHIDVMHSGPIDFAEMPFQWGYVCSVDQTADAAHTHDPLSAYRAAREHLAVCAGPAGGRQA